jgi:hypothetical protein
MKSQHCCNAAYGRELKEANVKIPRIRIAWVMAFVALAALSFGAIRAMSDVQRAVYNTKTMNEYNISIYMNKFIDLLEWGALPMANVLTVGLLIGCLCHGSRRFMWGFETFGAMALALFIWIACLHADDLVTAYVKLILPFVRPNGPNITTLGMMIAYSTLMVMLVLPQIVIAVAGGFLTRNFRVS